MIKIALLAENIPLEDFSIVPFPIDEPSRIENFLSIDEIFFLTIYDDWGRKKLRTLKEPGFKVEVLYEKNLKGKAYILFHNKRESKDERKLGGISNSKGL